MAATSLFTFRGDSLFFGGEGGVLVEDADEGCAPASGEAAEALAPNVRPTATTAIIIAFMLETISTCLGCLQDQAPLSRRPWVMT
jgi:hypothetical protein